MFFNRLFFCPVQCTILQNNLLDPLRYTNPLYGSECSTLARLASNTSPHVRKMLKQLEQDKKVWKDSKTTTFALYIPVCMEMYNAVKKYKCSKYDERERYQKNRMLAALEHLLIERGELTPEDAQSKKDRVRINVG